MIANEKKELLKIERDGVKISSLDFHMIMYRNSIKSLPENFLRAHVFDNTRDRNALATGLKIIETSSFWDKFFK